MAHTTMNPHATRTLALVFALLPLGCAKAAPPAAATSEAKPPATAPVQAMYGRRIVAPADAAPVLAGALADLGTSLHHMTGQAFEKAQAPDNVGSAGIFVVRA